MVRLDAETIAALELLGLSPEASAAEIAVAYRRQARAIHPDVCAEPGAAARFDALSTAYRRALDAVARTAPDPAARRPRIPARSQTPRRRPVPFAAGPVHYTPSPTGARGTEA